MDWLSALLVLMCCLWVFLVGLGIGSFINVVVARMPDQKSVVWPNSRCFHCLRPIRTLDNLPVLGYLRLKGKCRHCHAPFSSRYLWVELGVGVAFVLLFVVEVLGRATDAPAAVFGFWQQDGLRFPFSLGWMGLPNAEAWAYFVFHAALLSFLIAAALVDAKHKIIPPQITYTGTLVGLIGGALTPWPWPVAVRDVPPALVAGVVGQDPNGKDVVVVPPEFAWRGPAARIPTGAQLWPFTGPPPAWAPAGSWKLGLLNGLIGAAAGMLVGRAVKFLFEVGMGVEALGLGDADLLMMVGAFLGWQVAAIAMPVGAVVTLPVILPIMAWGKARGREVGAELPFGPGIAAGAVVTWLGWPWAGELVRVLFDPVALGVTVTVMAGGFLVAGLLLQRRVQE
jgi:leader peptidase (prepilin peptidase)/N-methyltransferase